MFDGLDSGVDAGTWSVTRLESFDCGDELRLKLMALVVLPSSVFTPAAYAGSVARTAAAVAAIIIGR